MQVGVEQELEESADAGPGTLECLHICKDHRVDTIGPHLNKQLAALSDLVLDEALLLLIRLDGLADAVDVILRLFDLLLSLENLIVVGALGQKLQPALSL